ERAGFHRDLEYRFRDGLAIPGISLAVVRRVVVAEAPAAIVGEVRADEDRHVAALGTVPVGIVDAEVAAAPVEIVLAVPGEAGLSFGRFAEFLRRHRNDYRAVLGGFGYLEVLHIRAHPGERHGEAIASLVHRRVPNRRIVGTEDHRTGAGHAAKLRIRLADV